MLRSGIWCGMLVVWHAPPRNRARMLQRPARSDGRARDRDFGVHDIRRCRGCQNGNGTAQRPHKTIAATAPRRRGDLCRGKHLYGGADQAGRKGLYARRRFPARSGVQGARLRRLRHQGRGPRRIVHPHRASPPPITAHGDRWFRHQRLRAGDFRDFYEFERFDTTNNYIHDKCENSLAGAGFPPEQHLRPDRGNVLRNNSCGCRVLDLSMIFSKNQRAVAIERNLIDNNAGTNRDRPTGAPSSLRQDFYRSTENPVGRRTLHRRRQRQNTP